MTGSAYENCITNCTCLIYCTSSSCAGSVILLCDSRSYSAYFSVTYCTINNCVISAFCRAGRICMIFNNCIGFCMSCSTVENCVTNCAYLIFCTSSCRTVGMAVSSDSSYLCYGTAFFCTCSNFTTFFCTGRSLCLNPSAKCMCKHCNYTSFAVIASGTSANFSTFFFICRSNYFYPVGHIVTESGSAFSCSG